mmetsp:Transcript_22371/g.62132  ORF Transcript_22371/g.62132 Transcript_22371/m.62132 type:complete len:237 (-) Transcript_22371:349-1059(-)
MRDLPRFIRSIVVVIGRPPQPSGPQPIVATRRVLIPTLLLGRVVRYFGNHSTTIVIVRMMLVADDTFGPTLFQQSELFVAIFPFGKTALSVQFRPRRQDNVTLIQGVVVHAQGRHGALQWKLLGRIVSFVGNHNFRHWWWRWRWQIVFFLAIVVFVLPRVVMSIIVVLTRFIIMIRMIGHGYFRHHLRHSHVVLLLLLVLFPVLGRDGTFFQRRCCGIVQLTFGDCIFCRRIVFLL